MAINQELRGQVEAYIAGRIEIRDVQHWLVGWELRAPAGETEADELADLVWILIGERDFGIRDDDDIRAALRDVISLAAPVSEEETSGSAPIRIVYAPSVGAAVSQTASHARHVSDLPLVGWMRKRLTWSPEAAPQTESRSRRWDLQGEPS